MTPEDRVAELEAQLKEERARIQAYKRLVRALESGRAELAKLAQASVESGAATLFDQLDAAREDARFWNAEATRLREELEALKGKINV